jgi:glucose-1-phosphate thymidylyltransferase
MLPAANRPILEHVLETLVTAGVAELILVVGYKRNRVQEHFGPTFQDIPIRYVVQEKQLGSGHALLQVRNEVDEPMLVVNGDRVIEPEMVRAVASRHEATGNASLAVLEHPAAHTYGAVRIDSSRVTELVEKPMAGEYRLINAGIYAFAPTIFDIIKETPRDAGELALTDALIGRIEAEVPVEGVPVQGIWADATYPWDLLKLSREVLREGRVSEGERHVSVYVSQTARIHDTATLQGPVVVGPDCEVGPGTVIGPDVALGQNVTVGANSTVVESVLDADTRVGPGSTLIETVTGQDVTLGAGTTVSGGPADVVLDERVFPGQDLGAVFADRVRSAGGVTADPGTLVGTGADIAPGVVVSGRIPTDAEVVR